MAVFDRHVSGLKVSQESFPGAVGSEWSESEGGTAAKKSDVGGVDEK